MKTDGLTPEMALLELELAAMEVAAQAVEAYEALGDDGKGGSQAIIPPTNVLRAIECAHKMILSRLAQKIGFSFDVNDLEGALLALERQKDIILQLKQRRADQARLHS